MGRINIDWKEVFADSPSSPARELHVSPDSPSSAPHASATRATATAAATRARALGVAKALSDDEHRRGSPGSRLRFGTLCAELDRRVGERRTAANVDEGTRRPTTRAAAKAAVGRGHDAHSASKGVYDFGPEDEQVERVGNRLYSKPPPVQKNKYGQLPLKKLKSQGHDGKRNPISADKMYSRQPNATSLPANKRRAHAIDPEEPDHKKYQKSESNLSSRFSKRSKEQLQHSSSVYSRKVQDVVLLDDEDMQPKEKVNCEMSDRRNQPKIYYPSRENQEAVELTRSDIKCLDPGEYLSSPVINFYIQYIKRNKLCTEDLRDKFYIFNTYFYGKLEEALSRLGEFSKLRRWWKGVNILNKAYIILPIHGTAHWSLVIICVPAKESISGPIILHLDSLGMHPSTKILNTVERYLERERRQLPVSATAWEDLISNIHKESVEVPRQNNEYDCGIFMLYYIERFISEAPERFTIDKLVMFNRGWFKPEEASDLRRRIRELLLEEFESAKLDDAISGADASECEDSIKDGELEADAPSDSSEMIAEVLVGLGNAVKSNEGIKVVASEEESGGSGDAGKSTEGIVAAAPEASGESGDAGKSIKGINVAESDEASEEFGETGKTNRGTKFAASEGASVESGYIDKSKDDISEVAVLDAPTSCYKGDKTSDCVLSEAASFSDSIKYEKGTAGISKAEREGKLIVIASPERSEGNGEIIGSTPILDVVCDSCDSDTEAKVVVIGVRKQKKFPLFGW